MQHVWRKAFCDFVRRVDIRIKFSLLHAANFDNMHLCLLGSAFVFLFLLVSSNSLLSLTLSSYPIAFSFRVSVSFLFIFFVKRHRRAYGMDLQKHIIGAHVMMLNVALDKN